MSTNYIQATGDDLRVNYKSNLKFVSNIKIRVLIQRNINHASQILAMLGPNHLASSASSS
jgi:hypothetical protein